ncbi:hypothetical protein H696_05960 [Fonticula alba]|uniref:asparaginase n=1 Tax=Fonticula alba TaxID=691883 RepID=A0A058Z0B5_FONAL|nr:hypothetical protein H696_05960 [Fonticula alba]KCV67561.1 hypothetical protein H696_05960 [Fonticula alba]|eukprot:XP_009498002.1 hypothetical protein H696_05960 [Fonticula alba]
MSPESDTCARFLPLNSELHQRHYHDPKTRNNTRTVLVINTGGTIFMQKDATGALCNSADSVLDVLDRLFELDHPNMPVVHWVQATEQIDSSSMKPLHWLSLAEYIHSKKDKYQGFVVTHGTDTMAYTGAALSFLLHSLHCPVIITGAQVPLSQPMSDGRSNVLAAIYLAGHSKTHREVSIFFHDALHRGNRSTKFSSTQMNAFTSPNGQPLIRLAVDPDIFPGNEKIEHYDHYRFDWKFSNNIYVLRLEPSQDLRAMLALMRFIMDGDGEPSVVQLPPPPALPPCQPRGQDAGTRPGQAPEGHPPGRKSKMRKSLDRTPLSRKAMLEAQVDGNARRIVPTRAIIIEAFGSGNVPEGNPLLKQLLMEAKAKKTVIAITSQCLGGRVDIGSYAAGSDFNASGCIHTGDMTSEAAYVKLALLLGQGDLIHEEISFLMTTNLRGEISHSKKHKIHGRQPDPRESAEQAPAEVATPLLVPSPLE